MKTHKDLDVWKKSIDFVTVVYKLTKGFPIEEKYGLTNQIRRSAVSIPSNIAEGAARNYDKEFIQFLYIALGSAAEIETQLIIACNLEFISKEELEQLVLQQETIAKLILGLIKYLKNK